MAHPPDEAAVTGDARPQVSLVAFDFDETLYDWIGHFVPALEAMTMAAAPILGMRIADLREELREVHRRYQNTEHPFALLETATAQARFGHLDRAGQREALAPAFAAFDRVRVDRLRLYDDAATAMARLRREGIPQVGFTAATSVNISKRIALLGLEDRFERVYAAPFTGQPYPGRSHPGPSRLSIVELPQPKPHRDAVMRIASDFGVPLARTLFVGDSFAQDIVPALDCGAKAAWVRRGNESLRAWLPSLMQVTHRDADAPGPVASDAGNYRVVAELTELWDHFLFAPTASAESS